MTSDNNRQNTDLSSLKNIATAVYALQAASFIFGITYFIAIIINYVKRENAQGTWIESHFRWQIRTFWFGLLWFLLGVLTYIFIIGWIILAVTAIWVIYRILKGWLNLYDNKPLPN